MPFVDTERFTEALNLDPEFKIAARFWNATVRLEIGDETYVLVIRDGRLDSMGAPAGNNLMTVSRNYDIEISAPVEEWGKFFERVPQPFYQDLFSAVTRHNFRYGGDMKMFFAYYAALRRLFDFMRTFTNVAEEAK
ncbi:MULTISPECIES: hypothetical protein [Rhodococcus]|jgi:hypothetical protein|uniref:SCP2 domain-containing protein n=1 Tax=Rhodococcus pseudokoreensis TaxID=2811421 RepID=A0A974ZYL9_9NOCA|nr:MULTISPECIES: hypothetical protein [Rhodococcus]MBV6756329.1 hypothetical protein [Rhodococcus opacus]OUS91830.1 hypothetical protein CA951_31990 [Rhodococcus sp. NCIMB 12038]QSE94826.1 hypothetical protein JWS13_42590 [Rhodococcus pseudokoreensis]